MKDEVHKDVKVFHLLTAGGIGGIEVLLRDVVLISKEKHSFAFLNGEGAIFDKLREESQNVYCCKDRNKLSLSRLLLFKKIAGENDIIVVHHNDPFLQMYYLCLKILLPKKKYIAMVHHCYVPGINNHNYGVIKRIIKDFLVACMIRISDRLIFVSKAGYESYSKAFYLEKKVSHIVYNGIGSNMLFSGRKLHKEKPKQTVRIVFVGRLVPIKGVDQLLKALSLPEHSFCYSLDIVGDGKARESLEKQARELGIQDIVFHGFQLDVRPFLDVADIFVYPSRTEVFGISIIEAMARGCICVANCVGGIPEIIHDGVNGFLNHDNNEQGLCNAIMKAVNVVRDDKKREEMLSEARKTSAYFTVDKTASALDTIFEKVINDTSTI